MFFFCNVAMGTVCHLESLVHNNLTTLTALSQQRQPTTMTANDSQVTLPSETQSTITENNSQMSIPTEPHEETAELHDAHPGVVVEVSINFFGVKLDDLELNEWHTSYL